MDFYIRLLKIRKRSLQMREQVSVSKIANKKIIYLQLIILRRKQKGKIKQLKKTIILKYFFIIDRNNNQQKKKLFNTLM